MAKETEFYSFDEIMNADDMRPVSIPIPEWGSKAIQVRPLSAAETTAAEEAAQVGGKLNPVKLAELLIAASLVTPAVTDEQATAMVANRSARSITRIVNAVAEINATSPEAKEALVAEFPEST